MSYLPDYITWRGDLPFAADPANDLDTLVMAALSYIDLPAETQVFAQCAKSVPPDDPDDHFRGECRRLLQQIAKSSRFGALTVRDAVSVLNDEIQFAAMTVDLPDGTHIIAFRGTDGSLTGWREDFAMSFESPVPAQAAAQKYLEHHLTQDAGDVIVTGHSKGGNLAVYSAAKSSGEIQERIVAVHNNDGPGFAWDISETPGHKRIASRIHTILPQTSVVGMLMEHEKRYQVVHSTYDGLYQHDGFSWQVLGTQFVHLDDFSREGKLVDETLSSWADSLNTQQREALADALYSVFTASGAKTLSELTEEKLKSAAAMLKTYKNLDRETRRMVTEAFMLFFKLGTKNFVLDTQEEGSREIENIRKKISEQYQKLVERKK
mgnify:CR=1 FL=1